MTHFIVGIRFQRVGKVYHFDAKNSQDIRIGDFAVVDTSRGKQVGEIVAIIENPPAPPEGTWKTIQRRATARDLVLCQILEKKEAEAVINCQEKVKEVGLQGVKIVSAEFSFDEDRITFIYCSEGDEKVDLKKLRLALKKIYPKIRIETRQVGLRDAAKSIGGMGACGLENRCCSSFLCEFSPISIKMAKEQGISLTPSEITGMCGRLRCCLVYEYDQYLEARKNLPKKGKRVTTSLGDGRVIDVYPLKSTVVVELDRGIQHEFSQDEIIPSDDLDEIKKQL